MQQEPRKRVLITGGAGFLGLHLANGLGDRMQSTLMDVCRAELSEYPPETDQIIGDVRDRALLASTMVERKFDFVIHAAAALPLAKRSVIRESNVEGTRNVVEAAADAGILRVVYISSTAVYGVPKKHPIVESDPVYGVGAYGETKIAAEEICRQFRRRGLCIPIVRPKTFVGTGRLGVFQILYDWVESGCRIPLIGSGKNRYQLLEVDDLVEAIYRCLVSEAAAANDDFNVGAERFGTVLDDVGALCEFAGTGARPMGVPAALVKPALAAFEFCKLSPLYKWVYATADKDSFVSTEKLTGQLGWRSRFSNAEALIRSYQWYLENKSKSDAATGITHRVAWRQGVLRAFKTVLR